MSIFSDDNKVNTQSKGLVVVVIDHAHYLRASYVLDGKTHAIHTESHGITWIIPTERRIISHGTMIAQNVELRWNPRNKLQDFTFHTTPIWTERNPSLDIRSDTRSNIRYDIVSDIGADVGSDIGSDISAAIGSAIS